jgi:hypothetical protein
MTAPEVGTTEAATPEVVTILVLGPMREELDEAGYVVAEARTAQLGRLVQAIVDDLRTAEPELGPIDVDEPHGNPLATIIRGILDKIEAADLVILDLSDGSQNVMYELGLVNAFGLPFVLTTKHNAPPFYMANIFCISNFEKIVPFDPQYSPHRDLRVRIRDYLRSLRDIHGDPNSFASNPVTDYFGRLPVVDISAPAGLAAGYWMNAVRRFVRSGGYFDRDNMVTFSRPDKTEFQQKLSIDDLVVVEPVETLAESEWRDRKLLEATLADHGYGMRKGVIPYVDPQDLRAFGGNFLGRVQADGSLEVVQPAIVIDMPTTLYALQYSPRVMRIGDDPLGAAQNRTLLARLRRRRYYDMLSRFYRIMHYLIDRGEAKGQADHVHFVKLAELPGLLNRLAPGT